MYPARNSTFYHRQVRPLTWAVLQTWPGSRGIRAEIVGTTHNKEEAEEWAVELTLEWALR